MKNLQTKFFITFVAVILFSAFTVFAAQTIVINPHFAESTVQFLQKLVLVNSSNDTWIILDWNWLLEVNWSWYFSDKLFIWTTIDNSKLNVWWDIFVDWPDGISIWERYIWSIEEIQWIFSSLWNTLDSIIAVKIPATWRVFWWNNLVISNSGLIWIGNDSPNAKLDIKWDYWIDVLSVNWYSNDKLLVVRWDPNNDDHEIIIWDIDDVSSDNHTVRIQSGSTIFSNGNVGIWIDQPDEKLHVNGTIAADKLSLNNDDIEIRNGWSAAFNMNYFKATNPLIIWSETVMMLWAVDDEWYLFLSWDSDYVWIATMSPTATLDVAGTGKFEEIISSGPIKLWTSTSTWCTSSNAWTMKYISISNWSKIVACIRTETDVLWDTYDRVDVVVATWGLMQTPNLDAMSSLLLWW